VPGELWGIPVLLTLDAPKDTAFVLEDHRGILLHPVAYLRCQYPRSPVWCERTVGHLEARRDRRAAA
jgi:hypothetical protein